MDKRDSESDGDAIQYNAMQYDTIDRSSVAEALIRRVFVDLT